MKIGQTVMAAVTATGLTSGGAAAGMATPFASIDGGSLAVSDWAGRPVLVVNTASRCGFTRQYDDMQALYDRYRDRGLVVLAVPSNDFRQELSTAAEVQEFCAVNFDLTLPMTDITPVKGAGAHPFYAWVRAETGFVPAWNFNKVLIAPDGRVAGHWGSGAQPLSGAITKTIDALLE